MKRWTRAFCVAATIAVLGVVGLTAASAVPDDPYAKDHHPQAAAITPMTNAANVIVPTQYIPITPCRIVDTRLNGGGFTAGLTKKFYVAGTLGFAPQGGKSGGCGIPTGASAVTASVTALQSAGPGFLRMWASGQTEPNATILNFQKLGGSGTSVSTTIPIRQIAGTGIAVKDYGAATNLVIDALGYYREPIAVSVNFDGAILASSNHITSVGKLGTGIYEVHVDQNVQNCVLEATAVGSGYNPGVSTSGTTVTIFTRNVASSTWPYIDASFYLTITC